MTRKSVKLRKNKFRSRPFFFSLLLLSEIVSYHQKILIPELKNREKMLTFFFIKKKMNKMNKKDLLNMNKKDLLNMNIFNNKNKNNRSSRISNNNHKKLI